MKGVPRKIRPVERKDVITGTLAGITGAYLSAPTFEMSIPHKVRHASARS
jgi:hypothetical protein